MNKQTAEWVPRTEAARRLLALFPKENLLIQMTREALEESIRRIEAESQQKAVEAGEGSVTGYDMARDWLLEAAPEWRVASMRQSFVAGIAYGDSTIARYEVVLVPAERAFYPTVELHGEGSTPRSAVENAIGGLRPA